jgi:hypothetical protein
MDPGDGSHVRGDDGVMEEHGYSYRFPRPEAIYAIPFRAEFGQMLVCEIEQDGSYTVSCPFMPGHVGAGRSWDEAFEAAHDAAVAWLAAHQGTSQ